MDQGSGDEQVEEEEQEEELSGYSNLSDTEAPKIPTFQGSKNSDTCLLYTSPSPRD